MIDSNNIIYFVKEYFAIIFYLLIIFNIVIRVIVTKKSKKKKSRKGGGILSDIWYVLLCIITFGWSCGFWDKKSASRPRLGEYNQEYPWLGTNQQAEEYITELQRREEWRNVSFRSLADSLGRFDLIEKLFWNDE